MPTGGLIPNKKTFTGSQLVFGVQLTRPRARLARPSPASVNLSCNELCSKVFIVTRTARRRFGEGGAALLGLDFVFGPKNYDLFEAISTGSVNDLIGLIMERLGLSRKWSE